MNSEERAKIRCAIRAFNSDGWDEGMSILCALAGIETPLAEAAKTARQVDLGVIARSPNQPFTYTPREKK